MYNIVLLLHTRAFSTNRYNNGGVLHVVIMRLPDCRRQDLGLTMEDNHDDIEARKPWHVYK